MMDIDSGSQEAMDELMRRYRPMVSRISYIILCDIPESESVTKEVFLKVRRSAGEYDFRHGVSVWISRIICNLCYIHLRRMRFLDLLSIRPSVYETSAPHPLTPEDDFITKETWEIYCRATRFMTPRERVAFVFRDIEGFTISDVSTIMHMRSGRVRRNLLAARENIQNELSKYGKVI